MGKYMLACSHQYAYLLQTFPCYSKNAQWIFCWGGGGGGMGPKSHHYDFDKRLLQNHEVFIFLTHTDFIPFIFLLKIGNSLN